MEPEEKPDWSYIIDFGLSLFYEEWKSNLLLCSQEETFVDWYDATDDGELVILTNGDDICLNKRV